ncbi:unnamed protein product [Mycena citricolor]|uniref:Uncharacterized protein n=1 Tax=Mycena citricolor TaxID=2018698 RepID=A0AAD2Q3Q1_9AGAR|nr:unnamed protein product [Mycena citricolor]
MAVDRSVHSRVRSSSSVDFIEILRGRPGAAKSTVSRRQRRRGHRTMSVPVNRSFCDALLHETFRILDHSCTSLCCI